MYFAGSGGGGIDDRVSIFGDIQNFTQHVPYTNLFEFCLHSVCADMKASAGGFYTLTDYSNVFYDNITFVDTYTSKRVCFIYDMTKPIHCTDMPPHTCNKDPLVVSERVTRTGELTVVVDGWVDPRPSGGENNNKSASGVDLFKLEVHATTIENGIVVMSVRFQL